MAKKFGKFLLFSAAVGAAAAGVYYYLQNKDADDFDFDSDDFDDSDETDLDDYEEKDLGERSYVDLHLDAPEASDSADDSAPQTEATVEEFFNDENE